MAITGMKYIDVASFVDDLVISGEEFNIHLTRLEKVLKRLDEFGFKLKAKKCSFAMDKIVFLGYLVSEMGIEPAPALLAAIDNLKIPTNVSEVRSIVGLLSYPRKCIDHFSTNIEPLTRLTKKDIPFIWGDEQQNAFDNIKRIYSNKPFLKLFDPKLETELRSDASLKGLGGALVQKHDKKFYPAGYFSRSLIDAETRYPIYDLEIMAAIESMTYFNDLLLGHYFKLVVDNRAVSFIRNKRDLNGRLARHALYLEEFNFDIEFRPSTKNTLADFLSRYPRNHKLVDGKNITESEIDEFESKYKSINCLKVCTLSTFKIDDKLKYIFTEQSKDIELSKIMKCLNIANKEMEKSNESEYIIKNFVQKNNIICRFVRNKNEAKYLVCVPKSMRYDILEQYHDTSINGHLGLKRTLNKIKDRFFWPDMNNFITYYIKTCKLCQSRKKPKTRSAGLMQPIITGDIFEQVSIDHLGPLVKSNGYEYIIVLTDNFSKFAICKPVAKNNAKSAAKFIFEDVICAYAHTPKRILSDCSQSFLGKIVSHLNILMGIKQVKTSGYRPSTNSVTERYNGTLAECLSLYVNEKQTNWSKYVKPITFAYNATIQASTNYSPVEILFGSKAVLPPDINFQLRQIKSTPSEYAIGLAKYLDDVKINVIKNLEKAHTKDKLRYDAKHRQVVYNIGDRILFYNPMIMPGRVNKLMRRFEGPYTILRQCSAVLYQLDFEATALKSNIVHVSRLKPFYDRLDMFKYFEQNSKPFISKSDISRFKSKIIETSSESSESYSSGDSSSESDSSYRNNSNIKMDANNVNDLDDSSTEISGISSDEFESDPNYNYKDGIRRSVRVRKPPNRLNLYLSTILCLISCTSVNSLATMEPLIWNKLNNPIIEGLETITTVVNYQSPCHLFNELMIGESATKELREYCESQFKTDFINPLNEFCTSVGPKDSAKFGLIREKRFIFIGALALFTIISVVTSVGIGASSLVESVNSKSRLENIEQETQIAIKNIRELKNRFRNNLI